MSDFLLRRARLVPLGSRGRSCRRTRSTSSSRRPGRRDRPAPGPPGGRRRCRRRSVADARALGPARAPRPVDAGVVPPRPDRHPLGRRRARPVAERLTDLPGRRSSAGVTAPPRGRSSRRSPRSTAPGVLGPGGADQRRRSPRLDEHRRACAACGLPERDGMISEGEWFRVYPRLGRAGRHRRHLAGGLPAHHAAGRRQGRGGPGRPRVRPEPERLARARRRRGGAAAGPGRGLRRHARRVLGRRAAHGRCDARLRPAGHDGPAEDHLRRVAEHPDGVVLLAVRRRRRARPTSPARACGGPGDANRRAHGGRHPRDRRRRGRPGARGVRRHRRPRLDRARPADPPRGLAHDGAARHPGQRAAGAPARRPRPHRDPLAGPHRPLLRAAVAAGRRRHPGPGLRRAGLARWTRGRRSRPPSTAAPTTASPGTPSRR